VFKVFLEWEGSARSRAFPKSTMHLPLKFELKLMPLAQSMQWQYDREAYAKISIIRYSTRQEQSDNEYQIYESLLIANVLFNNLTCYSPLLILQFA